MQEPLKKELIDGVAVLKKKVAQFDIDFELNGPMIEGIPAKEASERYNVSSSISYFLQNWVYSILIKNI